MLTTTKNYLLLLVIAIFSVIGNAQEEETQKDNSNLYRKLEFYNLRGTSVVDISAGTSLINNDYPEPELEFYFRLGFKHYLSEFLNLNLCFNRYNLAFNDTFNEGYMSFDLNLEYLVSPFSQLSPFVYGGYGYNTNVDFDNSQPKVQAGLGLEFIIFEKLGVKIFGEYNYVLSNELEGLIVPDNDESFIRAGVGLHFYFGGSKRRERLLNSIDTVINSNLIK